MLVRLPNGTINEVSKITPIIEKCIIFNGSKRILSEPVTVLNLKERPNAMKIYLKESSNMFEQVPFGNSNCWTIGNLKPTQVDDILKHLLEKGQFDFTVFEFQEIDYQTANYIFDDGLSKPYFTTMTSFDGIAGCSKVTEFFSSDSDSSDSEGDSFDEEFDDCDDCEDEVDYDYITDED